MSRPRFRNSTLSDWIAPPALECHGNDLFGDRLLLNEKHPFIIRRIAHYQDFTELLINEDPAAIAPDVPGTQLLENLRAIYPPEKEAMGTVALEIEPEPLTQDPSSTALP